MTSKKITPVVLVAAGALYDIDKNAVLMCQRDKEGLHPSEWEFPGGKIEKGETPEQALIRELNEELSIKVKITDIRPAGFASYDYEVRHVVILLYLVDVWSGKIKLNDHQSKQWVKVDDLAEFSALPADKPLLEALPNYI